MGLYVMWYKAYRQDPSMAKLQACFRVKSPNKTNETYYPYSSEGRMLKKETRGRTKLPSDSFWVVLGKR